MKPDSLNHLGGKHTTQMNNAKKRHTRLSLHRWNFKGFMVRRSCCHGSMHVNDECNSHYCLACDSKSHRHFSSQRACDNNCSVGILQVHFTSYCDIIVKERQEDEVVGQVNSFGFTLLKCRPIDVSARFRPLSIPALRAFEPCVLNVTGTSWVLFNHYLESWAVHTFQALGNVLQLQEHCIPRHFIQVP